MIATAESVTSSQDSLPVCLKPFENPYRLVSLLNIVKEVQAHKILYVSRMLFNLAGIFPPVGHPLRDSSFKIWLVRGICG